jgi:hypothetical protein
MQTDVVFFFDIRRISDPRTKNMNLVTTPDHFLNEINGLRRTAAGRRKKTVRASGTRGADAVWLQTHADAIQFGQGRSITIRPAARKVLTSWAGNLDCQPDWMGS